MKIVGGYGPFAPPATPMTLPSEGLCSRPPENHSVAPSGGKHPVWETLVKPLQLQLGFLNELPQLFRKLYSS